MTALRSLARARMTLEVVLAARALLVGLAVALTLLLLARGAAWLWNGAASTAWTPIAVAGGLLAAVSVRLRRGRVTTARAALWMEERVPALAYALVTAADPRHASAVPLLASRLERVPWSATLRRSAAAALIPPLALVLVAAVALRLAPHAHADEGAVSVPGARTPSTGSAAASSALRRVTVEVRAPAYAGISSRTEDDPVLVEALAGSAIRVRGGGPGAPEVTLDDHSLAVATAGERWSTDFTLGARATVLRLRDGPDERLILLEPRPDSVPVVTLTEPAGDSVLRTGTGTIRLVAHARDDLGLTSSAFEWIVSSGEGENYTFRNGTLGATTHRNARSAELRAALALDPLQLQPGDVLHLRAVARDGNARSGPGVGVSETRTIRVLRRGEGDSVAVDGAPPPELDTTAISQRMLLLRTERLAARAPRMNRDSVVRESRAIGVEQTRLRRRVGELVYMRLGEGVEGEHSHFPGDGHDHGAEGPLDPEQLLARASAATGAADPVTLDFHGDETPVVAINRPLLEAYNHMWDATRELDIGEPARALPPMRLALEALQRAREAERIYLRGRPPAVVVDVGRARLQGRERGAPSTRTPAPPSDPAAAQRARRLDRAMVLARSDARAASDSLLVLRAEALQADPALAVVLGEAAARLRSGGWRAAEPALTRARRAARPGGSASGALQPWSAGGGTAP